MLMCRYIKFYKSLRNSEKLTVRFLARLFERDQRTVLGSTLCYLTKQCGLKLSELDKLSPMGVRNSLTFKKVPSGQEWVCDLASEILGAQSSLLVIPGFDKGEIESLLHLACTS